MGGLHIATAYALESDTPMIYLRPGSGVDDPGNIEGRIVAGQTALIIDDLMTGGSSIVATARRLEEAGMSVRDAIVLIDREQGGEERLHEHGCRVLPILRLKTMLNYYHAAGLIDDETYTRSIEYLRPPGVEPAENLEA